MNNEHYGSCTHYMYVCQLTARKDKKAKEDEQLTFKPSLYTASRSVKPTYKCMILLLQFCLLCNVCSVVDVNEYVPSPKSASPPNRKAIFVDDIIQGQFEYEGDLANESAYSQQPSDESPTANLISSYTGLSYIHPADQSDSDDEYSRSYVDGAPLLSQTSYTNASSPAAYGQIEELEVDQLSPSEAAAVSNGGNSWSPEHNNVPASSTLTSPCSWDDDDCQVEPYEPSPLRDASGALELSPVTLPITPKSPDSIGAAREIVTSDDDDDSSVRTVVKEKSPLPPPPIATTVNASTKSNSTSINRAISNDRNDGAASIRRSGSLNSNSGTAMSPAKASKRGSGTNLVANASNPSQPLSRESAKTSQKSVSTVSTASSNNTVTTNRGKKDVEKKKEKDHTKKHRGATFKSLFSVINGTG